MKKFKKSFSVILLIIILFYQHCILYANQTVLEQTKNITKQQTSESTNYQNITNGGVFAEKDHFLYYFKDIGTEKCLPQLFRYDLEKNVEVGLSSDIFVQVRDMRVCNDGYVYFKGINIYDAPTSNYPLLYRIPINGGKSELIGNIYINEYFFLSDTWMYDMEKNNFFNVITKETIANTITKEININYKTFEMREYNDTIYIYIRENPTWGGEVVYQNDELLESGFYALPLHQQKHFHKIELEDDFISTFSIYDNTLYYGTNNYEKEENETLLKAYSLENGTTKTILSGKDKMCENDFAIYNDTLYYYYREEEKQGSIIHIVDWYLYGIKLNQSEPPFCVLHLGEKNNMVHIFENVICHVNSQLLSKYGDIGIGDWEINNYHTGEQYSIKPYVSGVAYIPHL